MLRRNRISILTGLKVSSKWHVNVYFTYQNIMQRGTSRKWLLKVLKCKDEMYQPIETNKQMQKNGVICLVIMFNPEVMVIIMSKLVNSLYFLLITAKTSDSLSKIFKCIKKISFSSFRKCYELLVLSYH